MRVRDIGGDRYTMRRTAMELEREFELSRTKPVREYDDPRPRTLQDKEREKRTGVDHDAMKQQLTEVWQKTQTGAEFKKEVEALGYVIARGDKVEYALIDPTGGIHSLSRRLEGVRAKDLRERFVDIDRQALPSVEQARQQLGNDRANGLDRNGEEWKRSLTNDQRTPDQHDRQGSVYQNAPAIQAEQLELSLGPASRSSIEVIDSVTGSAGRLGDVVLNLLSGEKPPPRGMAAEMLMESRAVAALNRMSESQSRGERLRAEDVAALTHHQLLNIRDKGDDYMRQLIDDNEKHSRETYVDSLKRAEKERESERER
jgi:hypothetical protein